MSVRSLIVVVIGIIAFVIVDTMITSVIVGTDTGSMIITSLLRVVLAASILIGVVKGLGSAA